MHTHIHFMYTHMCILCSHTYTSCTHTCTPNVHMCTHCTHTCVHLMHTHTLHVHTYTHTRTPHVHTHVHLMLTHIHFMYTHTHVHICTHHVHTRTHTHTHTHTHFMCTHMYTPCTHISPVCYTYLGVVVPLCCVPLFPLPTLFTPTWQCRCMIPVHDPVGFWAEGTFLVFIEQGNGFARGWRGETKSAIVRDSTQTCGTRTCVSQVGGSVSHSCQQACTWVYGSCRFTCCWVLTPCWISSSLVIARVTRFTILSLFCVLSKHLYMVIPSRALCRAKLLPVTRFGGHMDVNC